MSTNAIAGVGGCLKLNISSNFIAVAFIDIYAELHLENLLTTGPRYYAENEYSAADDIGSNLGLEFHLPYDIMLIGKWNPSIDSGWGNVEVTLCSTGF